MGRIEQISEQLLAAKRRKVEAVAKFDDEIDALEKQLTEALEDDFDDKRARAVEPPAKNGARKPRPVKLARGELVATIRKAFADVAPKAMSVADLQQLTAIADTMALRAAVARLAKAGELERTGRGMYQLRAQKGAKKTAS